MWASEGQFDGGDFVRAGTVKAFIMSDEYLRRFGMWAGAPSPAQASTD
jgi:hypothetical protein